MMFIIFPLSHFLYYLSLPDFSVAEGGSSAVTPASQDTRDQQVADSRVTSQAGSERDKSPSVISNITADQHAAPLRAGETMSEAADNNDELSSVDDEVR